MSLSGSTLAISLEDAMRNLSLPATALMLLCSTGAAQAQAGESERIFEEALRYTVKVKSAVPVPFTGDRKGTARGAGFVVDAERGWIMTNAHVVSRSPSRVEVAFKDEAFVPARKIYVDSFLDLALLEIARPPGKPLAAASLHCGELPTVGHPVGAFGHPWRLYFTGTRGIVSGVTSRYRTEFLQTDAPIDRGNSGGPLISIVSGRVVGINTAQVSDARDKKTNFAVSTKYACRVLDLLREGRDPSPPDLPVIFFHDPDGGRTLKAGRTYLPDDLLALRAGLIIRSVEGDSTRIENVTHLMHALRGRLDGLTLLAEENGQPLRLSGRLQPMKNVLERRGIFVSGVLFGERTSLSEAYDFRLPAIEVHFVEGGSLGQTAEVEPSDLVEEIDGQAVATLADVDAQFRAAMQAGRSSVRLTFRRFEFDQGMYVNAVERTLALDDYRWIGGTGEAR